MQTYTVLTASGCDMTTVENKTSGRPEACWVIALFFLMRKYMRSENDAAGDNY